MDSLLLRAIRKEPVERFPVWLMRQAGRYMKEYLHFRNQERDFLSLCKNVDLAVEISKLPIKLLGVDAIIIFSDILVPLEPLGVKVEFVENEGPKLSWHRDIGKLKGYDPQANAYVYEIITRLKRELPDVPVIGFCGAPFTLLSYMIEGGSSRDFRKTKTFMWEKEYDFHRLMTLLTETLISYADRQLSAGADLFQVFDSWTSALSRSDYEIYVLPYVEELFDKLSSKHDKPLIYFFRNSSAFMDLAEDLKVDVLSVDWTVDLSSEMLKSDKVFQGNLEPTVLYAREDVLKEKVLQLLRTIPRRTGYIFNLGHGIAPDMDFRKVKLLVDTVKSFSLE